jgi:uncharacterized BrkB/YihY/UPF0761 family membrane protein
LYFPDSKHLVDKTVVYGIVFGVIGIVLVITMMLFFKEVPEANRTLVDMLLGSLIGSFATIVAFYFGSSLGSKQKDLD